VDAAPVPHSEGMTMRGRSLLLSVALVTWLEVSAHAEPYMAVREGFRCSACHVNVTGGGKRNDTIAAHARDILRYPSFFDKLTKPAEAFSGDINQYLSIGADLRMSTTLVFQELGDNGVVENNTAFRGRLDSVQFEVNEADLYGEIRLIPDLLTLYVDQRFSPSTTTREVWGLLRLPYDVFLKAGKMFLPYGLQLQDDTAFIRGGRNGSATTGFSFNQQQAAIEVGIEPEPFSLIAAVSEGPSGDRDVQVTATASAVFGNVPLVRHVLAGTSFSRVGPPGVQNSVFGFFLGTMLGPVTYLGEVDFRFDRNDDTAGETRGTFLFYSEINYLLFKWLNTKVAFDYADDDGDLRLRADDSENRVSVGVEPFLNRFLQLRLFYRVSNGIEFNASHNQDLWTFEIHLLL
jgi:hypothetical protein